MRQPRGSPYKLARSGRVTSMQDSSRPGNQVVYQDTFLDLGLLPPGSDMAEIVPALTGVFQKALSGGVGNLSFCSLSGAARGAPARALLLFEHQW